MTSTQELVEFVEDLCAGYRFPSTDLATKKASVISHLLAAEEIAKALDYVTGIEVLTTSGLIMQREALTAWNEATK